MLKVAFVYPAFQNLGIEYISAVLKNNGHKTTLIFDPQIFNDQYLNVSLLSNLFDYRKKLINQIKKENPALIMFGIVSDNYNWACSFAKDIKSELNNIPIVFGGPHVTAIPRLVLQNEFVDFIVIGEGEYPTLELVDAIDKGYSFYNIENLGYKKKNHIIINDTRCLIQDLDELPFPDTELFINQNPIAKKEYNIITSRGCFSSCTYCHNSVDRKVLWKKNGKYLRQRSINNVINELVVRKKQYNINTICFWDEVFTYNIEWLKEFCEIYKKEINIPFWCFIHPNYVNQQVIDILQDTGCWEVEMGVQTLNPRIKKNILKRPESKEQVIKTINLLNKSKIRVVVDIIFGLPLTVKNDYIDIVNTFNKHRPTKIQAFWLRYYPKTELIDIAKKHGYLSDDDVKNINNNIDQNAAASGGSYVDKSIEKYQTLLILLPFLPKKVVEFILEKKWLKFLPRLSSIGHLFTRFLDLWLPHDIGGRRYKGRMIYFALKKILPFIK